MEIYSPRASSAGDRTAVKDATHEDKKKKRIHPSDCDAPVRPGE
jgi:hypothetical protein